MARATPAAAPAVPKPVRRPSPWGGLLIGAAAGYALAVWMTRNGVSWSDIGQRLVPPSAPGGSGLGARIAFARQEGVRAMVARRAELEAQAGRALAAPAPLAAGADRRNGGGGDAPAV